MWRHSCFRQRHLLGASTAVFGLLGAEGVFFYQNRELFGAMARRSLTNVVTIAADQPGDRIKAWDRQLGSPGRSGRRHHFLPGSPVRSTRGRIRIPRSAINADSGEALRAGLLVGGIFAVLAALKIFLA